LRDVSTLTQVIINLLIQLEYSNDLFNRIYSNRILKIFECTSYRLDILRNSAVAFGAVLSLTYGKNHSWRRARLQGKKCNRNESNPKSARTGQVKRNVNEYR